MKLRILVTGTRRVSFDLERTVLGALEQAFDQAQAAGFAAKDLEIVHGDALGADRVASAWAVMSGIRHEPHRANWDSLGRAAGPIRNGEMVEAGASLCLAFPRVDSVGTWDCVRRAADAGIPVRIFPVRA